MHRNNEAPVSSLPRCHFPPLVSRFLDDYGWYVRDGVKAVIAALKTSPCLRRLSLGGCQLGGDGGQAVIDAIGSDRSMFRLLDLDLSNNSLGAGLGEAIATSLSRNETLTRLSLRYEALRRCFDCSSADGFAHASSSLCFLCRNVAEVWSTTAEYDRSSLKTS